MKVLLDTSTIIAGLLLEHVHFPAADAWLTKVRSGSLGYFVSTHSVAETYSVLTRIPRKPRIAPTVALQMLEDNIFRFAQLVTVGGNDYVDIVKDLAGRALIGGIVHDAVIARAADLAQVDYLVTLNESHFQRVWPAGASRVLSALTPPP
jgi:predicted nucleic acid-binding protein